MKSSTIHVIDLTQIQGEGEFPCPKCGVIISPDDETETVYTIVDTKVKNESLEELVILCNQCESKIRLVGFLPLPPVQTQAGKPTKAER